jgi:DNA replication licensing factor MCM4
VSLYYPQSATQVAGNAVVDQDFLRDYILYARYNISPEVSPEAGEELVGGYLAMRGEGGRGGKTISATPRQLESLIRISQALAKMRLSTVVTAADVQEAIRLMRVATQTAATDPRTGTINMDLITTGRTSLDKDLVAKLAEALKTMLIPRAGTRLTLGQLRQAFMKDRDYDDVAGGGGGKGSSGGGQMGVSLHEIEEAVRELEQDGIVQFIERTQTVLVRTGHRD